MTYSKKTLQKLFVTGRYTLVFLLVGSALLWLIGFLTNVGDLVGSDAGPLFAMPAWVEWIITYCIYIAVAFVLNSFIIIEGRTPWMGGIMMWLTGLLPFVQGNIIMSLSLIMFILAVAMVISCYNCDVIEHRLFVTFMMLAVSTIIVPQFIYLLPFILIYLPAASVVSFRGLVASFIGFITPYWLYLGTMTLLSQFPVAWSNLLAGWGGVCPINFMEFSIMNGAISTLEIVIMAISVVLFVRGTNPTKPLMRRTLLFFILINIYLWTLSIFKAQDSCMLLAWRLPGLAAMSAYIFSFKFTKLFNIYFVLLSIGWIVIAILRLWNG